MSQYLFVGPELILPVRTVDIYVLREHKKLWKRIEDALRWKPRVIGRRHVRDRPP